MSTQIDSLRTERLILRTWRDADLEPFSSLNADPAVMEFMPHPLARRESDDFAARCRAHFAEHGFGRWAVEIPGVAPFIGFVGLSKVFFDAPFTPCIEVAWRLGRDYWGKGYATEAARASLQDGFGRLGLEEVCSFTVPANSRSRAVMERLGMTRNPDEDFDHPLLAPGHPLRRHVLYRIRSSA
ncbi:GNAT family N-acetyltransferase [Paludisphaera rhizosphaerae]|uniref:GNAT family N-acetyltransferase n=1 Tax=Paludisphaera rhizosphaerae TaxID=2711216 RepID=UPI0013EB23E6|nr:GNAT family N-acetyltransferase [Paludisphaera rhizosphaerae]